MNLLAAPAYSQTDPMRGSPANMNEYPESLIDVRAGVG